MSDNVGATATHREVEGLRRACLLRALVMVCLVVSCTPVRRAEGPDALAGPVCIAYDASKQEIQCPAPPHSFSGDNCTCVDSATRETFLGRVRGGL
jgi:hypothetical protein